VTALLRQGFPVAVLPPASFRVPWAGLASPTKPWPNRAPAGHLSISSQSPHVLACNLTSFLVGTARGRGARKKKVETVAGSRLRGQLVLLFLVWFDLLHIPPICLFCYCIIVPTLSFSGLAGQRRGTDSSRLLLAGWDDGIYPLFGHGLDGGTGSWWVQH
jgi:hypothetical protein